MTSHNPPTTSAAAYAAASPELRAAFRAAVRRGSRNLATGNTAHQSPTWHYRASDVAADLAANDGYAVQVEHRDRAARVDYVERARPDEAVIIVVHDVGTDRERHVEYHEDRPHELLAAYRGTIVYRDPDSDAS